MYRPHKVLVAAIDVGTTYSCCAFSFKHDYETDPLNVCSKILQWNRRGGALYQTPTCVLFNKDKVFDSFGYEAEDKYSELAEEEEHQEWYFFRRFKMSLFNKEPLSKTVTISATNGKEMLAVDVFSATIKFFMCQLQDDLEKRNFGFRVKKDIQWVLIVPAFWNDVSKHFMREAAEKAGISGDQILIVSEPEAVFVYSMHIKSRMNENNCFSIGAGTKCMVVIAENIGVEIAVYDVQPKGILKELYTAFNSDWAGNTIDASFYSLLSDIFGDDVMKVFLSDYKDDFLEMMNDFEERRNFIYPEQTYKFSMKAPIESLQNSILKMNPESGIRTITLSNPKYHKKVDLCGDKLRIDAQMAKALFDASCNKIIYHMQELFLYPTLRDVSCILLVGSYAKSPMLKFALSEAFKKPHREVFVPEEHENAAFKGAVIYGHKQLESAACLKIN